MKKSWIVFVLAALLALCVSLPVHSQTVGGQVEGIVTEEGSPLPNVQVVLTNIDNGKIYKIKTDKNGQFVLLGAPYGAFQVDVLNGKGEKLFTKKTSLGTGDTTLSNVLKIDIPKGGMKPEDLAASGPPPPKLTKEQLAKIEADNKKIAGLNSLINDAQTARQAQDWPKAENTLKQLIASAPESSRWDFYMFLGEAQSKQNKLQEATDAYEKGIQEAQSVASGNVPANEKIPALNPAAAKTGMGRMLTSQANAYLKLQKPDEAIASLKKAAAMDPSAINQYNLCGVEYSAQKFDDAKATCNKYLQLEPSGAHSAEVKGFLTEMGSK